MIKVEALEALAVARYEDACALHEASRHDGAVYLAGYAVELALKARICRTLRWAGFPETNREFAGKRSLRTHDLETLLDFSGVRDAVLDDAGSAWDQVVEWSPERRYDPVGTTTPQEARDILRDVKMLLHVLDVLPR
jgi:HEPN domain-containing protein